MGNGDKTVVDCHLGSECCQQAVLKKRRLWSVLILLTLLIYSELVIDWLR